MNATSLHNQNPPKVEVEKLIAQYGLRPILMSVLAFAVVRRRKVPRRDPSILPDHLRRDIGLNPMPKTKNYWDLH